jgi:hypothetical protein
MEYLLQNEYFSILKTKGVELVDYSKKAFQYVVSLKSTPLKLHELPKELNKLELQPPKKYFDNHSIANVWGVYQMARNANIAIEEIEGFEKEKLNNLYFKWLIVKNRLDEPIPDKQQQIQRQYAEILPGIKVLGKIDLSKFKK